VYRSFCVFSLFNSSKQPEKSASAAINVALLAPLYVFDPGVPFSLDHTSNLSAKAGGISWIPSVSALFIKCPFQTIGRTGPTADSTDQGIGPVRKIKSG
jgi:hypothetical protein